MKVKNQRLRIDFVCFSQIPSEGTGILYGIDKKVHCIPLKGISKHFVKRQQKHLNSCHPAG